MVRRISATNICVRI